MTTNKHIGLSFDDSLKEKMTMSIKNENESIFIYLKSRLGTPYYENENVLIFNLECINSMHLIENEIFDLTITSPPYNIGKEYEKKLPIEEYVKWTKEWVNAVFSLTKPNGSFLYNLGYVSLDTRAKAIPLPYLVWDIVPFYLIQEIVWNYGAGVAGRKFLSPRNEKWLWYVKNEQQYTFNLDDIRDPDVKYPNQKKNGKLRCNTIGKNPSDVWQIAKVTSGTDRSSPERTPHPAQFPIDLIDRLVKGFSNPNDLILDPFMGSGSTAISALKNGRQVVGFEIREDYCEIISRRIEYMLKEEIQKKAQVSLFGENTD
jgi:adenine-specific DNA-methyltransferase